MTEEMKYYTGNCITDLHTDTSFSYCNEEKCKQYIKSDGLNFCMSSVCPEKDCIYALVNKLHQKIDCLEQENKELKENLLDKYSPKYYDIVPERQTVELYNKFNNLKNQNNIYRSALEETREELCYGRTFYEGYFDSENLSRTDKVIKKINEVLQ